ncbi:MAG: prepilin-type N-terminal cleavage/methylation domain-containing protein [Burkholderiaceae bacterium]|jgi:general secretion pathway protein G
MVAMRRRGFTLIELLIVLAILALLLSLVAPRYFNSVDRAGEAVLKENLRGLRDTLDKFYADHGRYPQSLQELADKRYIRRVPLDPLTQSTTTWIIVAAPQERGGGVADIKSGAAGTARDGSAYGSW